MTGIPVRHTQFASWFDPDAWMEKMSGSRWEAVLKEEATLVKEYQQQPEVQRRLAPFRAAFDAAKTQMANDIPFESGPVKINYLGQFFKIWHIMGSKIKHEVRDLAVANDYVYCTEDVGQGAEDFELQCWKTEESSKKPVWKKHPVGPDVAVLGGKVFYLGVRNKLQYFQLKSCDAKTGKDETILYTEKSPMANLTLEKQPDGRLILIREISQDLHLFEVQENGKLKHVKPHWPVPSNWILPIGKEYGIDFSWPRLGYLITKKQGQKTLWHCGSNHSATKLFEVPAGDILLDPWAAWEGKSSLLVNCVQPDKGYSYYRLHGKSMELCAPVMPSGLTSRRFEGRSEDGTAVFGCLTYGAGKKPTKLLVVGYGAYGMSTAIGSVLQRWAPLVQNGWCVAHTFLRGGGDHTEAWAKAGRRSGRMKTFSDFKGLIFAAQQELNIPANRTVIYGRSAGGLLMGDMLRQDPKGELFQGVFAEVPYVDELRTTTNSELPLTALEYNEFGAPHMRLEDFLHVGLTSPADSASILSTPNTFVLTKTARHDSQVFAYEAVKWIRRLRANATKGAPKLCIVENGQGHFTPPDSVGAQWSVDCAFLDAWVEKNS